MGRLIKFLVLFGIIFYVLYALGYLDFDFSKLKKQVEGNKIYLVAKKKLQQLTDQLGIKYKQKKRLGPSKNIGPDQSDTKETSPKGTQNKAKDDITEKDRQELDDLLEKY